MRPGEALDQFFSNTLASGENNHYLVGVSGGVDSMTLLHELSRKRRTEGFELTVAHYNYRRHDHAGEAEELVMEWCDENDISFVSVHSIEVDDVEKNRRGIEAELRHWRYEFFESQVKTRNLDGVFLAHHRDDQVETVLLNLGRGTGLSGMSGMGKTSDYEGYTIYRPFLDVDKSTIRKTATDQNVPFVDDPSNQSANFTRNGLRHDVIEEWKTLQPDLKTSVTRLSELAQQENEFWNRYLDEQVRYWQWPSEVQICRESFKELPRAAKDRFLHSLPKKIMGDIKGWSRTNIDHLRKLFSEQSGRRMDLPGPLQGLVEYDRVCVTRTDKKDDELRSFQPPDGDFLQVLDGIGTLEVTSGGEKPGDEFVSEFPFEDPGNMLVRSWNEGDEIEINGETISLKELFQRQRVPLRARHMWPVLVDRDTVLGLPGLGISDEVKHNDDRRWIGFHPDHPGFHQLMER